jgi:hypothetical protein
MTPFSVGERVTILSGDRHGQSGEVVRVQLAQVYQVLLGDGSLLLYSQESLAREPATRPPHLVPGKRGARGQLV